RRGRHALDAAKPQKLDAVENFLAAHGPIPKPKNHGEPMITSVRSGAAGLILGMLTGAACQTAVAQQPQRKAIRPEKAPNTGLPFSPGILAGGTLYISGHLGRDPVTSKLVAGGIEAETRQSLAN